MKTKMKTIAEQLNVKQFPFIINDSKGNEIYRENSIGRWYKQEFDPYGNKIYYENIDGYIEDYRNVPEGSPEESPEEVFRRLIKDNVVLEACRHFDFPSSKDIMEIVLNGSKITDEYYLELIDVIMTDEYYLELIDVINNKPSNRLRYE